MRDSTHVYIGTLPCGCHVAAVLDSVDRAKETAKSVGGLIRRGYTISRHPLSALHEQTIKITRCQHEKQK